MTTYPTIGVDSTDWSWPNYTRKRVKFCPNCGTKIEPSYNYCPECKREPYINVENYITWITPTDYYPPNDDYYYRVTCST